MSNRPNEFLGTVFENRQTLLATSLTNHDASELKDIVSRFSNRTERLKNDKFKSNLDTIVSCVAFKRSCGMGVGKWMGIHCTHWGQRKRSRIIELCRFSAGIFMNWESIIHNITNSAMVEVDAKEFGLRKLYDARSLDWCLAKQRQNSSRKSTTKLDKPHQEYDERKHINILQKIKDEQILNNVNFDQDQADLIADRIKEDLKDICKKAR